MSVEVRLPEMVASLFCLTSNSELFREKWIFFAFCDKGKNLTKKTVN